MKIRAVKANNHKKAFEVSLSSDMLALPYVKQDPMPTPSDPVERCTWMMNSAARASPTC